MQRRSLLLVEDNAAHARLLSLELTAGEPLLDFMWVRTATEALSHLERSPESMPDLVLLDTFLSGGMNGFELLERIKSSATLRAIPVVMLATTASDGDVQRAYRLGANAFLLKPLEFDALRKMVRETTQFWCFWNRVPWDPPAVGA